VYGLDQATGLEVQVSFQAMKALAKCVRCRTKGTAGCAGDAGTVVEVPLARRHVAQGAASVACPRAARVLTATTRERDRMNEMTSLR